MEGLTTGPKVLRARVARKARIRPHLCRSGAAAIGPEKRAARPERAA